jgi:2-C-methyl-D-erythritol 2,4-cyclodiphosphate synthase
MRIGHGYDVHRLVVGRRLILGGIYIPFERGLLGHSDADVLTHALIDAVLGAAGLPDIGRQFPNDDPRYRNIDSILLLDAAIKKAREQLPGFRLTYADCTIVAEKPALFPYINAMICRLSEACGCPVNVKATTEEGLGIGETGIAAHAVVLAQLKADLKAELEENFLRKN